MDKRELSARIMKASPALYRLAYNFYFRVGGLLDKPRYLYCLLSGKPYFGPAMLAAQTRPSRAAHMRRAIQMAIEQRRSGDAADEFRLLEIGSWAGQSAILWAEELARSGLPGKVCCVDPWLPFAQGNQIGVNDATQMMDDIARRDKIFPLFWHNVKASGLLDFILPLRGRSADVLPTLRLRSFDLVFVDGSHAYSPFRSDLELASALVTESGFICGDDLERQSDEVDLALAEENREKDFIADPKTQEAYHPGICLGVAHHFKRRISVYDGFWIVRKNGDDWCDVQLYPEPGRVGEMAASPAATA